MTNPVLCNPPSCRAIPPPPHPTQKSSEYLGPPIKGQKRLRLNSSQIRKMMVPQMANTKIYGHQTRWCCLCYFLGLWLAISTCVCLRHGRTRPFLSFFVGLAPFFFSSKLLYRSIFPFRSALVTHTTPREAIQRLLSSPVFILETKKQVPNTGGADRPLNNWKAKSSWNSRRHFRGESPQGLTLYGVFLLFFCNTRLHSAGHSSANKPVGG